ncbi:phage-related protein [Janthinobacterium sp. Marseille]|nr:recombination protein NinB [Janthinobacterium sp. Marseille]ABR91759.1 phage-related protein [Janthinobacterium sp. Marseille]
MNCHFVLRDNHIKQRAQHAILQAPEGYVCTIKPATRSLEQNALLWSLLSQISDQVVWHGRKLTPESWKHVFSSGLKGQQVVPGLEPGTYVVCGISTSRMSKSDLSDLVELIHSFGASHGVTFNE